MLLVGYLRLSLHRTLDEAHRDLLERLALLGVSICRREVLYLFDAYCSLLRAVSDVKEDQQWLSQEKREWGASSPSMASNPIKATKRSISDVPLSTFRVLAAENVISSETEVMKHLLAPVKTLTSDVRGARAGNDE